MTNNHKLRKWARQSSLRQWHSCEVRGKVGCEFWWLGLIAVINQYIWNAWLRAAPLIRPETLIQFASHHRWFVIKQILWVMKTETAKYKSEMLDADGVVQAFQWLQSQGRLYMHIFIGCRKVHSIVNSGCFNHLKMKPLLMFSWWKCAVTHPFYSEHFCNPSWVKTERVQYVSGLELTEWCWSVSSVKHT